MNLIFHLSRDLTEQRYVEQIMELAESFAVESLALVAISPEAFNNALQVKNIRPHTLSFGVYPTLEWALYDLRGTPVVLSPKAPIPLGSFYWPEDPTLVLGDDVSGTPEPEGYQTVRLETPRSAPIWSQQAAAIALYAHAQSGGNIQYFKRA